MCDALSGTNKISNIATKVKVPVGIYNRGNKEGTFVEINYTRRLTHEALTA